MWLLRDLGQQVAELVAEQVELVAANLERDARLVEDEALLVDCFDALDDSLDDFFAAWSVWLASSGGRWWQERWLWWQLLLNLVDVAELDDTTALDGPEEASFEGEFFFRNEYLQVLCSALLDLWHLNRRRFRFAFRGRRSDLHWLRLLLNAEDLVEGRVVLPLNRLHQALLQVRLLTTIMRLHVLQAALDFRPRDVVAVVVQSAEEENI